ncbi:WXG100 family type VII secretion target [Nocardioides panacis]|uniref:WXG100 family type VII secretion target n=1 Tax=Nocardioides panacis TaxID=2849501 RepID=A0A975Y1F4_9ACTN|nr:WXG100 family type VII secretion target [Nocardioides panacis]QWZ09457.1 WXG100 family type VII secretion target [Nocardioides panacis]
MSDTELEIGAQTRAARLVADGAPAIMTVVQDLGTALEGSMSGFRGASAAAFVEAVTAWFEAAQDLGPALTGYAEKLVATDAAAARTETEQDARYQRLAGRLGGAQ